MLHVYIIIFVYKNNGYFLFIKNRIHNYQISKCLSKISVNPHQNACEYVQHSFDSTLRLEMTIMKIQFE